METVQAVYRCSSKEPLNLFKVRDRAETEPNDITVAKRCFSFLPQFDAEGKLTPWTDFGITNPRCVEIQLRPFRGVNNTGFIRYGRFNHVLGSILTCK